MASLGPLDLEVYHSVFSSEQDWDANKTFLLHIYGYFLCYYSSDFPMIPHVGFTIGVHLSHSNYFFCFYRTHTQDLGWLLGIKDLSPGSGTFLLPVWNTVPNLFDITIWLPTYHFVPCAFEHSALGTILGILLIQNGRDDTQIWIFYSIQLFSKQNLNFKGNICVLIQQLTLMILILNCAIQMLRPQRQADSWISLIRQLY